MDRYIKLEDAELAIRRREDLTFVAKDRAVEALKEVPFMLMLVGFDEAKHEDNTEEV